ncbi:MAG: hypothetical protein ABR587_16775, partial [Candidatus Binatia bacterium]
MIPTGSRHPLRNTKRQGRSPVGIASLAALALLAAAAPSGAATITGRVRFDGPPPQRPTIHMTADP